MEIKKVAAASLPESQPRYDPLINNETVDEFLEKGTAMPTRCDQFMGPFQCEKPIQHGGNCQFDFPESQPSPSGVIRVGHGTKDDRWIMRDDAMQSCCIETQKTFDGTALWCSKCGKEFRSHDAKVGLAEQRLREALRTFGKHTDTCHARTSIPDDDGCTCGLEAALQESPSDK